MKASRWWCLLILLLAACQAAPIVPGPIPAGTGILTPSGASSPTPILAGVPATPTRGAGPAAGAPENVPTPANGNDPVRFTFPSPAPLPASRWRPPLYEVPWALGPYDHFYLTRPIAADEVNWPEWDYRYGGLAEGKELSHSGIDIAATRNTPVIAAGPGIIGWTGYGLLNGNDDPNDPYGLAVVVEHDFGFNGHRVSTVYGHMARIDVSLGQRVQAGQQVGIVGTTGNSTGPHLHFEVRLQFGGYAATRNPELWLSPPQGWGVLVARLMREDSTPLYKMPVFVKSQSSGQIWEVHTYGPTNLHYDDYYRENLALSDLPAGEYEVYFDLNYDAPTDDKPKKEDLKKLRVTIRPGGITYFNFRDIRGFSTTLPTPSPAPTEWLVTPSTPKNK